MREEARPEGVAVAGGVEGLAVHWSGVQTKIPDPVYFSVDIPFIFTCAPISSARCLLSEGVCLPKKRQDFLVTLSKYWIGGSGEAIGKQTYIDRVNFGLCKAIG